ncbi:MAG TPA: methyltransferase domain-containing protein [Candidatus Acidoferrales bacterium]|nr:methyltransferase domain-containing protein [Candidatus Acidoferrales bacterium]
MPSWSPAQYLKFSEERTRPCRDLAARIELDDPRRIIDLGCGPGNSTEVLAARWPAADLAGLDSSADMIAKASAAHPDWHWIDGEIAEWAALPGERYDLAFSNAALQWVPDHATVLPRLLEKARALAFQIPGNWDSPAHRAMREVAKGYRLEGRVREWYSHDAAFYYDILARRALRLDLWETEYMHIMDGAEAIVEWYKGTGMRPFLEALDSDADRRRFSADYLKALRPAYATRPDGKVLFPFRRIFLVAYTQ